jgi:hypothetical protein
MSPGNYIPAFLVFKREDIREYREVRSLTAGWQKTTISSTSYAPEISRIMVDLVRLKS